MVSRGDTEKDVNAPRRQLWVRLKGAVCFMGESICSHRETPLNRPFLKIIIIIAAIDRFIRAANQQP